jgi:HNH endonuclease
LHACKEPIAQVRISLETGTDDTVKKTKDIPLTLALEALFWSNVWRYDATGCLLWMGSIDADGYGRLCCEGESFLAHRVAWCLHYRVVNMGEDMVTDHLCCVRPCVEWSHLETVTVQVNTLRGRRPQLTRERRLRTHCPKGHALVGENRILQHQPGGIRQRCRLCQNAYNRAYLREWRRRPKSSSA